MRIAILITCHNRCAITRTCLYRLFSCKLPLNAGIDVWLNDDGSTDETDKMIRREFPGVKIVKGSGNDFWCGGMRRVWRAIVDSDRIYDGYLWLNDDTFLYENALTLMLSGPQTAIVIGAVASPDGKRMTYGGRDASGNKIFPIGALQRVQMMNGNCVYVPHPVFDELGNFPDYLTHALGDFDYGLRAREHRIDIFESANYVGTCDDRKSPVAWMSVTCPFIRRLKNLYSPTGGPEPHIFFRYNWNHFGFLRALRIWLQQHIRVCFPGLWRMKK